MSVERLIEVLEPVTKKISTMDLSSESFVDDMEAVFPKDSELMKEVTTLALEGLEKGYLCDRENGDVKFSRVSKAVEQTSNHSIDAVYMSGPGVEHGHPKGEVSFCIATEGEPVFEGCRGGWAICRPDSTHVPKVEGGTMLILYCLPDGAVEWL